MYKRDTLKEALKAEAYPLSFTVKVSERKVPEDLANQEFYHLFICGTIGGLSGRQRKRTVPEESRGDREGGIWRQEGMEGYQGHATRKERITPLIPNP